MSFIMASHAGSQAEASKKRAELLRKMRDEFISASGAIYACKSEDRNDPAKPNCYCYTPDNQRNPSRGASDVCMKLWTGATLTAGNYTGLSTAPSTMICITSSNTADPACACKLNNTCMKVGVSGISGLNAGTMSMVSQSLAPLNQLASGAIDGASISDAALGNQAAKMNLLAKKLESSPKLKNLQANKKKATADLMARLNKASSQLGAGNLLAGSSSSGMPSNPGEAARMLEKEIASSQAATSVGGPGTQSVGSSEGAKTENFEFGLTGAQLAAQETQIAELMKQNLDYGGNDINQGSKANIFEVLSIRYQRSGMRRLFDEKGTTTADKPAKTEISR